VTRKPSPARPKSRSRLDPTVLTAAILGGAVLLGLLLLLLMRHSAPSAGRQRMPVTGPGPGGAAPLAPVYSGGTPPGRRRVGF
jgi:hypothetical protein